MNSEEKTVLYISPAVTYRSYEAKMQQPHRRRCIDGKITGCGNCIGYCQYREHPGYLTKELRKQHNCIKKGCRYYLPKERPVSSVSPFAALSSLY